MTELTYSQRVYEQSVLSEDYPPQLVWQIPNEYIQKKSEVVNAQFADSKKYGIRDQCSYTYVSEMC